MQEHNKRYPVSTRIFLGISSAIVVAGGFATWWAWHNLSRDQFPAWVPEVIKPSDPKTSDPKTSDPKTSDPKRSVQTELEAQVYWLKATETDVELVSEPVSMKVPSENKGSSGDKDAQVFQPSSKETQRQLLEHAFNQLIKGGDNSEYTTTIPQGTELRSISIRQDGIHIDLSQDFTLGGGTTAMQGRLAQVLYTATSINPNAKVWLEIEGQPLEYLGGEGIKIPQPLTRSKFEANYEL